MYEICCFDTVCLAIYVFFVKNAKTFHFKVVITKKEVKNRKCHINFCSQFCHPSIIEKGKSKFHYMRVLQLVKEGQVLENVRSGVLKSFSSTIKISLQNISHDFSELPICFILKKCTNNFYRSSLEGNISYIPYCTITQNINIHVEKQDENKMY